MHLLFETASGYAVFETHGVEDIGKHLQEVQQDVLDLSKFGKRVTLVSFFPFKNAAHALENINALSEGIVHPYLKEFLTLNVPKSKKRVLGVSDKGLASVIKQDLGIETVCDDLVQELCRGLRYYTEKLLSPLLGQLADSEHMTRAQLGLGHAYSRGKVRFNINRSDTMLIQAISLSDQLDKDINLFSMRVREWYAWHFPELAKLVADHGQYAQCALIVGDRKTITESTIQQLEQLFSTDPALAQQIVEASKTSMGTDISEVDMQNINHFAKRLLDLVTYRKQLTDYLHHKMDAVAPNLGALVGDSVGARLIAQAGSLTNLAKFPASTVQILGAEKALFRALKARSGKTPKYGLLFHSTFIGKSSLKNKGRMSRYLANKCSIASRIDSFGTTAGEYGAALREQVEQRLKFYENEGGQLIPNETVMQSLAAKGSGKPKKQKSVEITAAQPLESTEVSKKTDKSKSDKKSAKSDKSEKKDKDSRSEKKSKVKSEDKESLEKPKEKKSDKTEKSVESKEKADKKDKREKSKEKREKDEKSTTKKRKTEDAEVKSKKSKKS